ncbi:SprT-like family-domain-containing protein [Cadophora sp. MPI-SDFR-AT-0126]|nr:SprT-like family-domain-containing protein [Leotiomycetes sp. MPI-SDFR-AT-0126]
MARIVEDSDDEFPDVAELIHRKIVSGKSAFPESRLATTRKTEDDSLDAATGNRPTQGMSRRSENRPKRGEEAEIAKPRPKTRILNQTSDNPLLRPLAKSTSGKDMSKKLEKSSPKIEVRRRQLARDSSSNVYSGDDYHLKTTSKDLEEIQSGKLHKPRKGTVRKETKATPKKVTGVDSDEEYESNSGLSDFIVDDSTFLDKESVDEAPPPRSIRRLVQGRKLKVDPENSDSGDLEGCIERLKVEVDVFATSKTSKALEDFAKDYGVTRSPVGASKRSSEDAHSPSENKSRTVSRAVRVVTPPGSPDTKPKRLRSPKKQFLRIPSTPHRPSMDGFWQQDVVNDWNDEYSPQKAFFPKQKSGNNSGMEAPPRKSPVKQDRVAKEAKKAFSQLKHARAESFLHELDTKITNGEIARLSALTGGVKIIWSKKLNTTAGRANWKRETVKSSVSASDEKILYRHHAAIELAEKVIDDEERLLNVIAHEFCHLANFMVSNVKTNPHGREFKAWAAKCSRHFGDRGIEVTTKHSYDIDYKYVWECLGCSLEFKRHSKSIDPTRHQCGGCKSKLVQTKPVPRANAGTAKISEYQLFVKKNMKRLKEENPGSPQKDIMGLVGKEYQLYKASKLGVEEQATGAISIDQFAESKEGTPEDDVGAVARKLDFLDLTSP